MCPLRACSYSGHVARRVQQAEILQQIAVWERAGAPTLSGPQPESSPAAAACERLRSPLKIPVGLLTCGQRESSGVTEALIQWSGHLCHTPAATQWHEARTGQLAQQAAHPGSSSQGDSVSKPAQSLGTDSERITASDRWLELQGMGT
ncbi:hypothetical protein SRHO_G00110390 [Serrasalmus rhombeus]